MNFKNSVKLVSIYYSLKIWEYNDKITNVKIINM